MRPTISWVALSVLALACAGPAPSLKVTQSTTPLVVTPVAPVKAEVSEDPEAGHWSVSYELPPGSNAIAFTRDVSHFRQDEWRITDTAASWFRYDGHESLRLGPAAVERRVRVEFAAASRPRVKDYETSLGYSDGGQLLYTGHLEVFPLRCDSSDDCQPVGESRPTSFAFRTLPSRTIVAARAQGTGALRWTADREKYPDGLYVFFGDTPVAEEGPLRLIVDPGLPAWMHELTSSSLPELFEFFSAETSTPLSLEPIVLVSYGGAERPGTSSGGGTLGDVLQLRAAGRGWLEPTSGARAKWFRLLAHEAFHFWNRQMFSPVDSPGQEWLSEGASDYFALRALARAGFISSSELQGTVVDAANRCLQKLGGKPLLRSFEENEARLPYTCGVVIHFAADGALRRAGPKTLGSLFGALFDEAAARDTTYATKDYLRVLRDYGVEPVFADRVKSLLYDGVADRAELAVQDLLLASGLDVHVQPLSRRGGDESGTSALGELVADCDCGRNRSITRKKDRLLFHGQEPCGLFKEDTAVLAVEGHAVINDADAAFAAARARILEGSPLRLQHAAGRELALPCFNSSLVDRSYEGIVTLERLGETSWEKQVGASGQMAGEE